MTAQVKLTLHDEVISRMLSKDLEGATKRAAKRTRERAQTLLVLKGRIDTGDLLNSIAEHQQMTPPTRATYIIGSDLKYAIYQEYGTNGAVAKPGKVLRFKPKESNKYVFAKRVRGFPGAHYLRGALKALSIRDFLP